MTEPSYTGDAVDLKVNNETVSLSQQGYFEFKDIKVTIGNKEILKGISGRLEKGKLVGILGGSGAGKTTFLNAISGRLICNRKNKVTGQVAYKGEARAIGTSDSIKHISAYVLQEDILCPTQTPYEALRFSAFLRLPTTLSNQQKEEQVERVIKSLRLEKCKDTKIGNEIIRGISGGEKKRTSVAVELVTDPELIFLDEPTSGLDSFTAMKTLEILKDLKQHGKQIIATIHQPSSEIFSLLDYVMLLADGCCVYYGTRDNLIDYFRMIGHEVPQYCNPADFVVNHIQENPSYFIETWKKHNEILDQSLNLENYPKLKPHPLSRGNFFVQLQFILKREFDIFVRDPRPSRVRLIQTIVFAGLIAILYMNLGHTQSSFHNRFGAIFFLTINSSMSGVLATIVVFPEQRLLFEKERDANMYATTTYFISKTLVQIPEQCIFGLLYLLIIYWSIGMDSTFGQAYLSLILCISTSGSLGLIVGCFAKNLNESMQYMPLTTLPLMLFAGFLVSINQIPEFIRWIQWIDVFKYMVNALCITEFRNVPYQLDPDGQGYSNGNEYLESIDMSRTDLIFDWYMMAVLYFGFRLFAWLVLVIRNGF